MTAWSLRLVRYVSASPAHVWAVITDPEGTTPALPGVVGVLPGRFSARSA